MREPRNPFRMRSSENIDSDATFIRLFCPEGLDILPEDKLWERMQIFRSAPGGGKTTLLRAFTPSILNTLYESKTNEDYQGLFRRMKKLDVINEDGPKLLGVVLSCSRNYAILEDLNCSTVQKRRLLFALLNARIILATLRNMLILKQLNYPNDLCRITFEIDVDLRPAEIGLPCTGQSLYEWARSLEKSVSDVMDSFGPIDMEHIQGHETIMALKILKPDNIWIDGTPLNSRILIMFDDVHQLSLIQRRTLIQTIIEQRPDISIWIAERLEALAPDELLAPGGIAGREYENPIIIEEYWRKGHSKRFEKAMMDIADRRTRSAREIQLTSFDACLQKNLEGSKWNDVYRQAIDTVKKRMINKVANTDKYDDWINSHELMEGSLRDQAIEWRTLEIMIERDLRKNQLSFDFGNILPLDDLENTSSPRSAAELYLAQEFKMPYYYGSTLLAAVASSNIEQFLDFSGELFEEIIASALLRRKHSLNPTRQEAIQKKVAQQRWDDIVRRIPNGRSVQVFLLAIKDLAKEEWNKGTASYGGGGGVTGIGITMEDRDLMINPNKYNYAKYKKLIDILSLCISYNLLEVSLGLRQGGRQWMVLYLNRWLCLHFGLPLQYGGWKSKKPDELIKWCDKGFQGIDKNGGSLFNEG